MRPESGRVTRRDRVIAGCSIALGTLLTVGFAILVFTGIVAEGCEYAPPEDCGWGGYFAWASVFLLPILVGGLWIAWRVGSGRPLSGRPRASRGQGA